MATCLISKLLTRNFSYSHHCKTVSRRCATPQAVLGVDVATRESWASASTSWSRVARVSALRSLCANGHGSTCHAVKGPGLLARLSTSCLLSLPRPPPTKVQITRFTTTLVKFTTVNKELEVARSPAATTQVWITSVWNWFGVLLSLGVGPVLDCLSSKTVDMKYTICIFYKKLGSWLKSR